MNTKRLTILAMLIAINVVLSLLSIKIGLYIKISLAAFPILVGALLYGPIDGMIIGTLGSFLYQAIEYGLMPATILYVIPYTISGLLIGAYSKRHKELTTRNCIVIASINAITITLLNTIGIYIQSKAEGWYTTAYVFGSIPLKIVNGILSAILFSAILPRLVNNLKNKSIN